MLCQRHITPPHCLSKEQTLNPRVLLAPAGPKFCLGWLLSFRFGLRVSFSLHFVLLGFDFVAFWPFWALNHSLWPFRGRLLGHLPQVARNGPFAQRPYNGFISVGPGSILQFLAFWAFISLHFGLVGLHFLAFWPCGPSFPRILALWAFISSHFGLVGLHFLAFWPCGPSFPCILALWVFISLHLGLFGVGFWPPPACCQKWPVCPTSLQWIYQRRNRLHFAVFSLPGLHFRAFWPCGPSFPFISGQALALCKRPLPEI